MAANCTLRGNPFLSPTHTHTHTHWTRESSHSHSWPQKAFRSTFYTCSGISVRPCAKQRLTTHSTDSWGIHILNQSEPRACVCVCELGHGSKSGRRAEAERKKSNVFSPEEPCFTRVGVQVCLCQCEAAIRRFIASRPCSHTLRVILFSL